MPRQCFNNFGVGKISPNGELLFFETMDNLLILNFSLYETKEGKGSSSSFV
jgi:hypothetical protein